MPDLDAGCSLADGCPAPLFAAWLKKYPGHAVVCYINCSAAVKALSDVICTSTTRREVDRSRRSQTRSSSRPTGTWAAGSRRRRAGRWCSGRASASSTRRSRRGSSLDLDGAAPRRRGHRAPRVRGAHPRARGRSSARRPALLKHVVEEPEAGVHRRDGDGHPPPDAKARPGQALIRAPPGRGLPVRHVPLHAAQHDGEALPRAARPRAARSRSPRRCASGRRSRSTGCSR